MLESIGKTPKTEAEMGAAGFCHRFALILMSFLSLEITRKLLAKVIKLWTTKEMGVWKRRSRQGDFGQRWRSL
ncbi:hypothetical protein L596_018834 [Steinernema carpocapsae]|uniref:Uncharacterized protein n=1 Tax=Steinernema carpocapsae TaxID=34508 RepID=A0A4U5N5U0_STECR|nr:hypothetical protein L596_018834 [Steinernema carpocapsae]